MRKLAFPFLIVITMTACSDKPDPGTGEIEFTSPELSSLINKDAKVEIVAEGFEWAEGPVVVGNNKCLFF